MSKSNTFNNSWFHFMTQAADIRDALEDIALGSAGAAVLDGALRALAANYNDHVEDSAERLDEAMMNKYLDLIHPCCAEQTVLAGCINRADAATTTLDLLRQELADEVDVDSFSVLVVLGPAHEGHPLYVVKDDIGCMGYFAALKPANAYTALREMGGIWSRLLTSRC